MKYTIEAIENAKPGMRWEEIGCHWTLGQAYLYSKEAGNDLPNFAKVIWDYDIENILADCRLAFSTRFCPSSPSSSKPGVSIITTGPSGKSSIARLTGSVVVPFTSETTDKSKPVKAFTTLDLPAFLIPKKAICIRSPLATSLRLILTTYHYFYLPIFYYVFIIFKYLLLFDTNKYIIAF